jgi:hypothetical protein
MSPTLNAYLGKMLGDLGATAISAAVLFGDRLGLFNALREGGKMTADELTARTGTQERLVREWLSGQAAAGYIEYEAADWFYLSPEQELVCADETSPACRGDAIQPRFWKRGHNILRPRLNVRMLTRPGLRKRPEECMTAYSVVRIRVKAATTTSDWPPRRRNTIGRSLPGEPEH